ncbi:MAG TPA: hypothetical protein PLU71_01620 [Candidatus Dependentiae bacterium]|nr:hypothetical protein [Candidatus Dependentiae bacterium]HRQ62530.1 hypothetical protein [Candidatus Dependentiae bacterium]
MERTLKKVLSIALLLSSAVLSADSCCTTDCCDGNTGTNSVTPKYTIRSQGTNAVRRMIDSVGNMNLYDMDKLNGTMALTLEYTQSFNNDKIAECLFGTCDCNIKVQGSNVDGRDANALLADYFYLPTDYDGSFSVDPKIQNFMADFFFYFGLDEWAQGLYFWVQFPVTWTKWNLNFCDRVNDAGTNDHAEGYFTPNVLPRSELLGSFKEYIQGNTPGTITQTASTQDTDTAVATVFNALGCAKICGCGETSKTTVSEVRFALGWNFLLDEDYHLGLNIQASAPTGNDVSPTFLFAAQNGNDKHWELGAGLGAHFIIWRSEDEEKHFGFYLDANVTHMFKNSQCRCFDLCGKPLSRYMLAEKLAAASATDNLSGGATDETAVAADYQFAQEFAPVANLTNFKVDVSVAVNADIVAMFNYTCNAWNFDFGYNFWGRSCEKIRLDCDCTTFAENTWALKGDSQVYGYFDVADAPFAVNDFIALSATQSQATINAGTNGGTPTLNPNVDNAQLAFGGPTPVVIDAARADVLGQTNTSIQPVFIKQSDINFARTKGISNKVFANLGYTWVDREDWIPYLSVGFEAEFGSNSSCDCADECCNDCGDCGDCGDCDTNGNCLKCSLSQWGVFVKGGLSFN